MSKLHIPRAITIVPTTPCYYSLHCLWIQSTQFAALSSSRLIVFNDSLYYLQTPHYRHGPQVRESINQVHSGSSYYIRSTRAKIVIRTKLPTIKRYINPTVPIFKDSTSPTTPPVQGPAMQAVAQQPNPPIPTIPNINSNTIQDSSTSPPLFSPSIPDSELSEKKSKKTPLPTRLRIPSTPAFSSSATPILDPEPTFLSTLPPISIPIPTPVKNSQYTEEYETCPCADRRARGLPPCNRCHLMLLADRYGRVFLRVQLSFFLEFGLLGFANWSRSSARSGTSRPKTPLEI